MSVKVHINDLSGVLSGYWLSLYALVHLCDNLHFAWKNSPPRDGVYQWERQSKETLRVKGYITGSRVKNDKINSACVENSQKPHLEQGGEKANQGTKEIWNSRFYLYLAVGDIEHQKKKKWYYEGEYSATVYLSSCLKNWEVDVKCSRSTESPVLCLPQKSWEGSCSQGQEAAELHGLTLLQQNRVI